MKKGLGRVFLRTRIGRVCWLAALFLLATIAAVKADDFTYTTNSTDTNTVTITGYTGSGGAVDIPSNIVGKTVTSIGDSAFAYCASLTSVTIPNGVASIGIYAFLGCTSLTSITVEESNSAYSSTNGVLFDKSQTLLIQYPSGKAGSYTIGNSVTSIGSSAFAYCAGLTGVTIPDSVASIELYAFYGCGSLANITIPNSVASIGEGTFRGCTSLARVMIGNGVTSIGYEAFAFCISLTRVTIGSSVTSIGEGAFNGCASLTGVYFQGNAPGVGPEAFNGDTNATVYRLSWTTGWVATLGDRPTALWTLEVPNDGSLGVQANLFGFNIDWATGKIVVVEACTNLANTNWVPVETNTLTDGTSYFGDPQWMNHIGRFYRLRSP